MARNFAYIRKGISFNRQLNPPLDPEAGDIYFDETLLRHRKYENGAWQDLSNSANLRATLWDSVDAALPATTSTLIDGQTVVDGNTVLFSSLVSPVDPQLKSLIHFNGTGTPVDEIVNTVALTGSAVQSPTQAKFGAKSLFCNTSGGVLVTGGSPFVGSGQFTFDCWVYYIQNGAVQTIFEFGNGVGMLFIGSSVDPGVPNRNKLKWISAGVPIQTSVDVIPGNTWTHIAVTRDNSNVVRTFINGSLENTHTFTDDYSNPSVSIGYSQSGSAGACAGYVDESRLLIGRADWTASFTVPSSPYSLPIPVINDVVYRATVVAGNITWVAQTMFSGSASPSKGDMLTILSGSVNALSLLIFDGIAWSDFDASIGPAENGSYLDGLFTDFTPATKIGVAVDRFNEVLKQLTPQPAPTLDHAAMGQTGTVGHVSFGVSNPIVGYSNVTTAAGGTALDRNGLFVTTGQRRGFFPNTAAKSGTLADDIPAGSGSPTPAYPANSFGNGDTGLLKLEVNGVVVQTVDLTVFTSGTSTNGNGSGFTLSAATSVSFPNGVLFTLFKYRTGSWTVGSGDIGLGYNYVRVSHFFNSVDHWTNYWEWCVDTNAVALSASSPSLGSLAMTGSKYLSGVNYNTGGSALYGVTVSNAYRDCYSDGNAISFNGTNGSIASQSIPAMTTEADTIVLSSKTFTVATARILNASITASVNCTHPTKATLSGGGSQTISGLLVDIAGSASTDLIEYFDQEGIRQNSNSSYNAQGDLPGGAWVSTLSIANAGSAGYNDGLLYYNSYVCYPNQGANGGNFGGITNGPANPDYSGGNATGTRSVYIRFRNPVGGSTRWNFKLNLAGSGTTFNPVATGPVGNAVTMEMKFPTGSLSMGTGWMDAYADFATGQWADGNGCRSSGFGPGQALNTDWGITVGTKSIAASEYIVIRIKATSSWTGNISQITLTWL